MVGTTISHYRIESKLGAGAMGQVYRARDTRLDRYVAIKVLTAAAAERDERLARFEAEARAVSALNHPNILTLHEIGESEHGPYIVTELVEGRTLRELLAVGPLPTAQALEIAVQVAAGLARAHAAGVVHRDMKPENVMVTSDGLVKILDFGLAKLSRSDHPAGAAALTTPGMIVGTPAYLAPEQLEGHAAGPRSDLYALGVVLYEMLDGKNPFRRDTISATLRAILTEGTPPLPQGRSGERSAIGAIIKKATDPDEKNRYPSAEAMSTALRQEVVRLSSGTHAVGVPARRVGWSGWAAGVVGLVAVGLLVQQALGPRAPATSDEPAVASFVGTRPIPPPAGRMGVAVFPIRDETGDERLATSRIGRILGDAFVQILSDVPSFYVISPERLEVAARAKGRSLEQASDDPAFARKIGEVTMASLLLSGTLSRLGNSYILAATLTEIPSERVLETIRARSSDPESLLTELTGTVSEEIRSKYAAAAPDSRRHPGGRFDAVGSVATRSLDAYAHFLRGEDLVVEGDWNRAIPELLRAVEIDPSMALSWSSLSCAYSFAGDDARARAAHRKAFELLDHVNEMERRWIELDGIWVRTGDGDAYLSGLQEYLKDFPDDRDAYFYGGLAKHWLKDDPAGAIPWFEQAYELIPNYWPVTKALVDCYEQLDQRPKSVDALRRYLSIPFLAEHGRTSAARKLDELSPDVP